VGRSGNSREKSRRPTRPDRVLGLIGCTPDPKRDRPALRLLKEVDAPAVGRLAAELYANEEWRHLPVGTLMPGLDRGRSAILETLSTRSVNALGRIGVTSWSDLGKLCPASLLSLSGVGPVAAVEILSIAAREWAGTFLDEDVSSGSAVADELRPTLRPSLSWAFEELEAQTPWFDVFKRRKLIAGRSPTLKELAAEFDITREGVRRREVRAQKVIETRLRANTWLLNIAVNRIRHQLGPLARPAKLSAILKELDPGGEALRDAPHRRALLLQLAGYRITDAWVFEIGLDKRTDELLDSVTEEGAADLDVPRRELAVLGIEAPLRLPWIESRPGFRVVNKLLVRKLVVRKWRNLNLAERVLADAGEPLTLEELLAQTGLGISLGGFRDRILSDSRFLRYDVRRYGLSEWEGEPYTTIGEMVAGEIKRNGGAVDRDVLIDSLTERFEVARGTVRKATRAPQFAVDSANQVSLRPEALVVPRVPLSLTPRCFRLESGWALRIRVNHDLLRGSGNVMPLAFAGELGLRPAASRVLASPYGKLSVSWPKYSASAHLGSLRIAAKELGAIEGDRMFVIFCGEDRIDFRLIGKRDLNAAAGMARVALECGLTDTDSMPEILTALGLDPNLPEPASQIRARLTARRKQRLADETCQ
jgi:hypothetical protein